MRERAISFQGNRRDRGQPVAHPACRVRRPRTTRGVVPRRAAGAVRRLRSASASAPRGRGSRPVNWENWWPPKRPRGGNAAQVEARRRLGEAIATHPAVERASSTTPQHQGGHRPTGGESDHHAGGRRTSHGATGEPPPRTPREFHACASGAPARPNRGLVAGSLPRCRTSSKRSSNTSHAWV